MINALKNQSDRILVRYENKPCYDIFLSDSFASLPDELAKFHIADRKICIVSESNVAPIYADTLENLLKDKCRLLVTHVFEAGEEHKNLDTVNGIYETLIKNQFDRKDLLLALGGGVVGDITGFAAATYLRGIDFIQLPTSLISQVDSSIGGKTGVDFHAFKNMVGAFYMPKLVYMNINTLSSLPEREYLSGMGEVIKHGLIKDAEYFDWLLEKKDKIFARDFQTLKEMLYVNCQIKRNVVEKDPKELGERAILNYGHTIGHAVEKLKNFTLLHGECVALGIAAAASLQKQMNLMTGEDFDKILNILKAFHLPVSTDGLEPNEVVTTTFNDKKMEAGKIKFILLNRIGEARICKTVTEKDLLYAAESIIR